MKCPLHAQKESKYKDGVWDGVTWDFADCIREECAWYNSANSECSICTISRCLLAEQTIKEIRGKAYAGNK